MSGWNRNDRTHTHFPNHVKTAARQQLPAHCAHCGTTTNLELDHIHNQASGGSNTLANAQWLCAPCHQTKTRREAAAGQQARRERRHRPTQPHPGLTP